MRKPDRFEGGLRVTGYTPDDDDDAVEDVVRVPQVLKEAEGCELQDHLQREHAGEHDVADLQNVGQLVGLGGGRGVCVCGEGGRGRKNSLRLQTDHRKLNEMIKWLPAFKIEQRNKEKSIINHRNKGAGRRSEGKQARRITFRRLL